MSKMADLDTVLQEARARRRGAASLANVRKEGGSRTIAVTKLLPRDWLAVKVVVLEADENTRVLVITKLDLVV